MNDIFLKIKKLFAGKWQGEGFAKFPTITATAYTEQLAFIPDENKDAILFQQKAWYKNATEKNRQTVFWDSGFIILKDERITLHSAQVGGRVETLELVKTTGEEFTFNSSSIANDPISLRSQRIFTVSENDFHYELNMATKQAGFQNHLSAHLKRIE
jgi:hypothetical protein